MKKIPGLVTLLLSVFFYSSIYSQGIVYYVDDINGNDSNDGLTIGSAWQTIVKVSGYNLQPGDTVKFKRGGVWRGQLLAKNGTPSAYVVYSDYGTGAKPVLMGSVNKSTPSDWISEGGNIWRSATTSSIDIGNLIFNGGTDFGRKKWNQSDLQTQGDFWWDATGTQYGKMYSASNPATYYSDIEVALTRHIVYLQLNSYVIFENLALKYGSADGFEIRNTHHAIIQDCDISFIGGGEVGTGTQVRYGNAVQFWQNNNNCTIQRCKIWEIYDTGVTNQSNNSGGAVQQYHLYYRNNLIWNCAYASFEVWVNAFGTSSSMHNIYFENNTCMNAGGGWGDQHRPDHFQQSGAGSQVYFGNNSAITDSMYVRNNIFYKSHCVIFANNESSQTLLETDMDYNCLYQSSSIDTLAVFWTSSTLDLWTQTQFAAYQAANNRDLNSITSDPLMIDPTNLNFMLTSSSPCIDAGVNTGITEDFGLNAVPQNGIYDIGAYEYFVGMNIDDQSEADNMIEIYPNPSHGLFSLTINSADLHDSQINVFDLHGGMVISISNVQKLNSLDLSEMPSGLYFLSVAVGNQLYSKKIVIAK